MSVPEGHCRRCGSEASRLVDGLCEWCERDLADDRPEIVARTQQSRPSATHGLRRIGGAVAALAAEPQRPRGQLAPVPDGPPSHLRDLDPDVYLEERDVRAQMDAVVEALELDGLVRAVASHMAKSATWLGKPGAGSGMYESNTTLAAHVGCSVDTVKRARTTLRQAGVIVRTGERVIERKKTIVYAVGWAESLRDPRL